MSQREEIARRHGIPLAADQLVGDSPAELEADAAARAAVAQMFGSKSEPDVDDDPAPPEPSEPEATEAAEQDALIEALFSSRKKAAHEALIETIHPDESVKLPPTAPMVQPRRPGNYPVVEPIKPRLPDVPPGTGARVR